MAERFGAFSQRSLMKSLRVRKQMKRRGGVGAHLPLYGRMLCSVVFTACAFTPASLAVATSCAHPVMEASATLAVDPETYVASPHDFPVAAALVSVTIGPDGNVRNVLIYKSTGIMRLDRAALLAARASRYAPKLVNCEPVTGEYLFRAEFNGEPPTPTPVPSASPSRRMR
ncbi:MAG TPA: TonB family protein [Candidatus Aquilonibacter sp.]|nr:TonB family protein [Candidatus Aquilonibacter sp.]